VCRLHSRRGGGNSFDSEESGEKGLGVFLGTVRQSLLALA